MGCDIHSVAERRRADGTWEAVENVGLDGHYSYEVFAFLAGVRNSFDVPPISSLRGFPEDASKSAREERFGIWGGEAHSTTWLSMAELDAFDYEREFDAWTRRRDFKNVFQTTTYRAFLGPHYFDDLFRLKEAGAERIVFWFDG